MAPTQLIFNFIQSLITDHNSLDQNSFYSAYESSVFFAQQLNQLFDNWQDLDTSTQGYWIKWLSLWSIPMSLEPHFRENVPGLTDRFADLNQNMEHEAQKNAFLLSLRLCRLNFQLRAIYREYSFNIVDHDSFIQIMNEYSAFADTMLQFSIDEHHNILVNQWDIKVILPQLITFGMGKLGANELNLSSDIDLIFAYSSDVKQLGPNHRKTPQEFYAKVAQRVIHTLSHVEGKGFVFRVDMRLRPYGQSGPLVWSTNAMENYYEEQGRMWERYAWIKARVISGGEPGQKLLNALKPFVYKRYIDFGAIESLRQMKSLIEREVKTNTSKNNIKIGMGGIREVEFIIQAVQLIRGGELVELQETSLLKSISIIEQLGLLPKRVLEELESDYIFLRRLEHFLQAYNDQQTQELPQRDDLSFDCLASSMGFDCKLAFAESIQSVQQRVHKHFINTMRPAHVDQSNKDVKKWQKFWQECEKYNTQDKNIKMNEYEISQESLKQIIDFKNSKIIGKMSDIGLKRLNDVMPMVLMTLWELQPPKDKEVRLASLSYQLHVVLPELELHWPERSEILKRTINILESIARRSAYLALLFERPQAIEHMVKLCASSHMLAEQIAMYPILLEECIDVLHIKEAPNQEILSDELRQQLIRIPQDDFELQLARLRSFKQRHLLRVGAADTVGELPLMKVSDYLTWLAQVLLSAAMDIAWLHVTKTYGKPKGTDETNKGLVIVGYGKLGGLELSYTSDLDLVFLYEPTPGETVGLRPLDNSEFYTRFIKKIIHVLATDTLDGRLYEVDLRLRPSGHSGLLVSSFESFKNYQIEKAWVWEQQALVRARPVAGDGRLFKRFEALRFECLERKRDKEDLRIEILKMREKMLNHMTSTQKIHGFDIKQHSGGLIDVEFIAQYFVLNFGPHNPSLLKYTDNVRIFDAAEDVGIIPSSEAKNLRKAYLVYRALIHRMSLYKKPPVLPLDQLSEMREIVENLFKKYLGCLP